ncbi:MAG: ABC transporter permease [Pseudodesulfovibrio sp.]
MIVRENLREAGRSLWGAKQRTLLALIGIAIGIGSVIALVTVGQIVQNEALIQFKEMGTDIITITHNRMDDEWGKHNVAKITPVLAEAIPESCPAIRMVAPYNSLYGEMLYAGKRNHVSALGVTEEFAILNKLDVVEGRFISDLDRLMHFCVISQNAKKLLAEAGMTEFVGSHILYKGRRFTICGVIGDVAMGGMRPYEIRDGIMIPLETAIRIDPTASICDIIARMAANTDWHEGQAQVQEYFVNQGKGISVSVRSSEELIAQMREQMRLYSLLLGAIGCISLVVGGVGVMNVMLASVAERRMEIGIRRALGAQKADIQFQFIMESGVLCLMGGVTGIALGVGAAFGFTLLNNWNFFVSWQALVLGVGLSFLVGLFFGYYPARQASSLNPIEALRKA